MGFNSPIGVKDGVNFYMDENYSIFQTAITEMELLKNILILLKAERECISSPEVDKMIKKLTNLKGYKEDRVQVLYQRSKE